MKRFYFMISFLGDDMNESFLVGRCLKILHGFYHRHEIKDIGVSFPDWTCESIGKRIAFVSTNVSSLKFLVTQKYFTEMKQLHYFEISGIQSCLLKPNHAAVFTRNHKIDELTSQGQRRKLRRLIKRAEIRGEIYQPKGTEANEFSLPFCHEIPTSSSENKNDFFIKIEKNPFKESNGNIYNSYGLSTNVENVNPVPITFD